MEHQGCSLQLSVGGRGGREGQAQGGVIQPSTSAQGHLWVGQSPPYSSLLHSITLQFRVSHDFPRGPSRALIWRTQVDRLMLREPHSVPF